MKSFSQLTKGGYAVARNKKAVAVFVLVAVIAAVLAYIFLSARVLNVSSLGNSSVQFNPHPISGVKCENSKTRPYAVMLAADRTTRPLAAISAADVVVEMPVVKDNITRLMALYACNEPTEIGSVRSARDDFIPIAAGFDAIYAHWGGSSFSLDLLKRGVVDNIDALPNPYDAFFRSGTLGAPHNGFTSFGNLHKAAQGLRYRTETNFVGYPRVAVTPAHTSVDGATLSIKYPSPYDIDYIYNKKTNSYLRWRGGQPELDRLDNTQAAAGVVIVMFTRSRALNADYNDVGVTGAGRALIFQNGEMLEGEWSKDPSTLSSKLFFKDAVGLEVPFATGPMWLEVVDIGTRIIWGGYGL